MKSNIVSIDLLSECRKQIMEYITLSDEIIRMATNTHELFDPPYSINLDAKEIKSIRKQRSKMMNAYCCCQDNITTITVSSK